MQVIKRYLLMVLLVIIFASGAQEGLAAANSTEILSVLLDKDIYQKGESVNISIENNTEHKIAIGNIAIEYFEQKSNSYKSVNADIQCPCATDCLKAWIGVDTKETKKISWNQKTDQINLELSGKIAVCKSANNGKYRVKVDYIGNAKLGAKQAGLTIYSEEFSITGNVNNLSCDNLKKEIAKDFR